MSRSHVRHEAPKKKIKKIQIHVYDYLRTVGKTRLIQKRLDVFFQHSDLTTK